MLSRFFGHRRHDLTSLSEQQILALAISSEEDDARIYLAYADGLREDFPQSAKVFEEMAEEENSHRQSLIDLHKERFGSQIPLIRREHVRGYLERKPDWLVRPLGIDKVREMAEKMEEQAYRFYTEALKLVRDASTRRLLGDLAIAEKAHESLAHRLGVKHTPDDVQEVEKQTERRQFILTYIQPGLAGLMDGSVSTLAPIFAAAFATQDTWQTFLVGLSASLGAGISMGFTEAAHDDGKLSGRGSPLEARLGQWLDDDDRRPWPRAALSHSGFLDGNDNRGARRLRRVVGHRLYPAPLYGDAVFPGGDTGRSRWQPGAGNRYSDWQCVIRCLGNRSNTNGPAHIQQIGRKFALFLLRKNLSAQLVKANFS